MKLPKREYVQINKDWKIDQSSVNRIRSKVVASLATAFHCFVGNSYIGSRPTLVQAVRFLDRERQSSQWSADYITRVFYERNDCIRVQYGGELVEVVYFSTARGRSSYNSDGSGGFYTHRYHWAGSHFSLVDGVR